MDTPDTSTVPSNTREILSNAVRRSGLYIVLLVVMLVTTIFTPDFLKISNLLNVSRQAAVLSIVSVGQLLVMLVGGIDLSVGSLMTTATVIAADITRGQDNLLIVAIPICVLIGILVASLNIFLIIKRNVPPFIATLGTYMLLEGARLLYTKGIPQGAPPPFLRTIGGSTMGGVPIPIIIAILVLIIGSLTLRKTTFGRRIYATGSNREAARLSGVPVYRIIALSYILCSLLAVLAGLILGGYIGYSDRFLGRGFDLDSISAVVVGGASFAGGIGTVEGTVAGILLMTILSNILYILNVNVQLQYVLKGVVILAAVSYYSLSRRDN
jgi:ribose/xylose/arabinose/galactoside ABC-type transport system permease subunit